MRLESKHGMRCAQKHHYAIESLGIYLFLLAVIRRGPHQLSRLPASGLLIHSVAHCTMPILLVLCHWSIGMWHMRLPMCSLHALCFFPQSLWAAYWVPCSASTDYVSPTDNYLNASRYLAETACAYLRESRDIHDPHNSRLISILAPFPIQTIVNGPHDVPAPARSLPESRTGG